MQRPQNQGKNRIKKRSAIKDASFFENFYVQKAYLIIALRALPGLNLGTFFAAIVIFARVTGLIPVRLFLFITEKVPKPVRTTVFPCFSAPLTVERKASSISLQTAFDCLVDLAIDSINFALFINILYLLTYGKANKIKRLLNLYASYRNICCQVFSAVTFFIQSF